MSRNRLDMTPGLPDVAEACLPEAGPPRPTAAPANVASSRFIGYLLGLAIVALWGASFPLTKAALAWLGPTSIAFVRWAISALVLVGWLAVRGRLTTAARLVRTDTPRVLWLAFTGVAVFYGLENVALSYTTATNAGILSNLTTVFMVLIAVIWYGERLRTIEWLALGTAFAGAALVSQGTGHISLSGPGLRGDLLMIVATVFGAIYSVGGERLTDRYPADVTMAIIALAGALMLLPLALHEGLVLALPPAVWLALLLLGVGAGALANQWWLHLLSYMDASQAGMFLFLIPIFSTFLAVVYLHEPLTPLVLAGAALVLAGVAVMKSKT